MAISLLNKFVNGGCITHFNLSCDSCQQYSLTTQRQISDILVHWLCLWQKELHEIPDCFSLKKLTYKVF